MITRSMNRFRWFGHKILFEVFLQLQKIQSFIFLKFCHVFQKSSKWGSIHLWNHRHKFFRNFGFHSFQCAGFNQCNSQTVSIISIVIPFDKNFRMLKFIFDFRWSISGSPSDIFIRELMLLDGETEITNSITYTFTSPCSDKQNILRFYIPVHVP